VSLPARFPARRLLKVVSLFLGTLVFGLLAAIVLLTIFGENGHDSVAGWVLGALMMLPGLFVLKFIADSFSTLEVDERGVRVRKWVGGTDLEWREIGSVRYWEQIQHAYGQSREWFLEARSPDGRRLLRLKSTYELAAVECLMQSARARNIRIDQ
jgi:hypothetical protein